MIIWGFVTKYEVSWHLSLVASPQSQWSAIYSLALFTFSIKLLPVLSLCYSSLTPLPSKPSCVHASAASSLTVPGEGWPVSGSGGSSWNTGRTPCYFYVVPEGWGGPGGQVGRWAQSGVQPPSLVPGGCHLALGKHHHTMPLTHTTYDMQPRCEMFTLPATRQSILI